MRILFDNVNFLSSSGPNSFGLKLAKALSNKDHILVEHYENPDVQLSFIQAVNRIAPIVQRIDGIWFNSLHDWKSQNAPILRTFHEAKSVIAQSEFDKKLIEEYFGHHDDISVIHNGTDIDALKAVDPLFAPSLQNVNKVWSCAASWRPHKRLKENVRYFMEYAAHNDVLIIAGENPDVNVSDHRVFYAGNLDYQMLASLYRTTDYFLHLAWLDHCPNVVIDANASGCHIICSSTGGTHEIAGENSTIIEEDEWDFKPCELYNPPAMDFSRKRSGQSCDSIDINDVASMYEAVLAKNLK